MSKFEKYLLEAGNPWDKADDRKKQKALDDKAWDLADDTGCSHAFALKALAAGEKQGASAATIKSWCEAGVISKPQKSENSIVKSCWGCGKDWYGTRDGKSEGNAYLSKFKGKLMCPPCQEEYAEQNG